MPGQDRVVMEEERRGLRFHLALASNAISAHLRVEEKPRSSSIAAAAEAKLTNHLLSSWRRGRAVWRRDGY